MDAPSKALLTLINSAKKLRSLISKDCGLFYFAEDTLRDVIEQHGECLERLVFRSMEPELYERRYLLDHLRNTKIRVLTLDLSVIFRAVRESYANLTRRERLLPPEDVVDYDDFTTYLLMWLPSTVETPIIDTTGIYLDDADMQNIDESFARLLEERRCPSLVAIGSDFFETTIATTRPASQHLGPNAGRGTWFPSIKAYGKDMGVQVYDGQHQKSSNRYLDEMVDELFSLELISSDEPFTWTGERERRFAAARISTSVSNPE